MKVSKLIEELQIYMQRCGDLTVTLSKKDDEYIHVVKGVGMACLKANEKEQAIIISEENIERLF